MSFRPCFLVPVFNHWKGLRERLSVLSGHAIPIYLVDDGSDEKTQDVLKTLAAEFGLVRLFRLRKNQGKGAAVMCGLREAARAGHSHALQIDADGQHDLGDIPRFLSRSADNPGAMICGWPVFDASAPKKRRYGRYVTHFWVGVETLSFCRKDALCGFRVYPLDSACRLAERVSLPPRMNFDLEIFVRLIWDGVPTENIPTRVIYPEDGLSHFDLFYDNVRISWSHCRLFFGMLLRLPALLGRKIPSARKRDIPPDRRWSEIPERGSALALSLLVGAYRILGERASRCLLYPVVAYFFLTGRQARKASREYWRRLCAFSGRPAPGAFGVFRHMLAFGHAGLDRLAVWAGKDWTGRIEFPERAELERIAASRRGAVLIASHLGNVEFARALALKERVAVNAVVYTGHARRFNDALRRINADFGVNLIQVADIGPDTAILLKEKIERGELVVIVGDRTPPFDQEDNRVARVDFLGESAPFAQGPFILSSLMDCPVYLFFCLPLPREGKFRIYLERFADRIILPRRERQARLKAYVQQYAGRLERYCLTAPDQWFNFYDFWRRAQHD